MSQTDMHEYFKEQPPNYYVDRADSTASLIKDTGTLATFPHNPNSWQPASIPTVLISRSLSVAKVTINQEKWNYQRQQHLKIITLATALRLSQ